MVTHRPICGRVGHGVVVGDLAGAEMIKTSEHQEQVTLFQWAAWQSNITPELKLLHAIPNGGHRHKSVARELKAEGVKAGIPDVFFPVARGEFHGLYIEMKAKGGRTRDSQKWWLQQLSDQGYKTAVCYSYEEARGVIEKYLESSRWDVVADRILDDHHSTWKELATK